MFRLNVGVSEARFEGSFEAGAAHDPAALDRQRLLTEAHAGAVEKAAGAPHGDSSWPGGYDERATMNRASARSGSAGAPRSASASTASARRRSALARAPSRPRRAT